MCGHAERNDLRKHTWCYLSHRYSVYEILKNMLCRLQNALPFYKLHQDETNLSYHWQKMLFYVIKIMAKRRGRPKLCCSFNFCLICNSQGMKCQRCPQTCSLSNPLLSIRQRQVSSLIMFMNSMAWGSGISCCWAAQGWVCPKEVIKDHQGSTQHTSGLPQGIPLLTQQSCSKVENHTYSSSSSSSALEVSA